MVKNGILRYQIAIYCNKNLSGNFDSYPSVKGVKNWQRVLTRGIILLLQMSTPSTFNGRLHASAVFYEPVFFWQVI